MADKNGAQVQRVQLKIARMRPVVDMFKDAQEASQSGKHDKAEALLDQISALVDAENWLTVQLSQLPGGADDTLRRDAEDFLKEHDEYRCEILGETMAARLKAGSVRLKLRIVKG